MVGKLLLCACVLAGPSCLIASAPGSNTIFLNSTGGVVSIRCQTATKQYREQIAIRRGHRFDLSGDYAELISLTLKYPDGRAITLGQNELEAAKAKAHFRKGVWWIVDEGVQYISEHQATLWQSLLLSD
jgi:hypothetical protein